MALSILRVLDHFFNFNLPGPSTSQKTIPELWTNCLPERKAKIILLILSVFHCNSKQFSFILKYKLDKKFKPWWTLPFVLHQWESWSSSASEGACYLVAKSSLQTGKPRLIPDPHPDLLLTLHLTLFRLKPMSISGRNWSTVSKPSLQNWTNLFEKLT